MLERSDNAVQYLPIAGFPGYRVGDDGSVWTCWKRIGLGGRKGKLGGIGWRWEMGDSWRKMGQCRSRYRSLGLRRDGHDVHMLVHRLVLEAFVGPCPDGMQCLHDDGNNWNNSMTNLRWGTPAENCADRTRHGRGSTGERNPKAKLTEAVVMEIRRLHKPGDRKSITRLARVFQTPSPTIRAIVTGQTWKHLLPKEDDN